MPFVFSVAIKVRISDINYGGHVGNDSILSILHEARLAYLNQWGFNEMNAGGCGLIMADSAVQYRAESFYGDTITASIYAERISNVSFDLYYKLTSERGGKIIDIAFAKTGMITFDYKERKMIAISALLAQKLFETN